MNNRIYSSYEQIDADLEILKIEKEINYQKVILGFQKTKEHFTPTGVAKDVFSFVRGFFSHFSLTDMTVLKLAIPFVIKWVLNKKRS